jgi:putative transcriptional regulator
MARGEWRKWRNLNAYWGIAPYHYRPLFRRLPFFALRGEGAINMATMREFDQSCLSTPAKLDPQQIKRLREANHVSQPVFARYLNTNASTVQKWESGAKRPSGMALKLLGLVEKFGVNILA